MTELEAKLLEVLNSIYQAYFDTPRKTREQFDAMDKAAPYIIQKDVTTT